MDGPTSRFGVLGGHPTIYPVDLPSWLPGDVVEQAIAHFEGILRQEIFKMMMDKSKKTHARHPSEQSSSALSTGSHGNGQGGQNWKNWESGYSGFDVNLP